MAGPYANWNYVWTGSVEVHIHNEIDQNGELAGGLTAMFADKDGVGGSYRTDEGQYPGPDAFGFIQVFVKSGLYAIYLKQDGETLRTFRGVSIIGSDAGAIRYDIAQTLSALQKSQAQANAGLFELYVTAEAYGAKGDFGTTNTDDTAAFDAASAFLSGTFKGGCIKLRQDRQYLIDDNLTLDVGVSIVGSMSLAAQGTFLSWGSTLRLNPAKSITLQSSCGLQRVAVINKNITSLPRQDSSANYIADATANLALFSGTGVILDGVDICIESTTVAGFSQCFDGDECHRLRMTQVMFDGLSGVRLSNMLDVSRLYGVHGFPLLTSGLASLNTERTLWTRSGIGFDLSGVNDGLTLTACFCFCYSQGFTNNGGQSVIFTDCWSDYFAELQATTTIGFHILNNAKLTQLNGSRASSVGRGLVLNTIDATTVVGWKSWACAATHVECLDGYVTLDSPDMRVYGQTGTLKGLVIGSGIEAVKVISPTFRDFSTSHDIDGAVRGKVEFVGAPLYIDCTDTVKIGQAYLQGDAALSMDSLFTLVQTSAAFTAPRTWTLPAAGSVAKGKVIEIDDIVGAVSSTNTLTIARAGSDTINGATSLVLNSAYARVRLISDGVSKWSAQLSGASQLANDAVTNAKLANMAAYTVKANNTGSTADPSDASISTLFSVVGQIEFPATQNPSSNANTLDDYEEGTWTPGLTFPTPGNLNVVYDSSLVGIYTKVGRLVTVAFSILTTTFTHTTASGNLTMTGLPFTASDMGVGIGQRFGATEWGGITKAGYTHMNVATQVGAATAVVTASGSGVAVSTVAFGDCPSGGTMRLRGGGTYST